MPSLKLLVLDLINPCCFFFNKPVMLPIDDMDAKMKGLGRLLKDDKQEGSWTAFSNLFQRYLFPVDV